MDISFEDSSTIGLLPDKMSSGEDSPMEGIHRVPDEVLIKIFADLPLRDRISSRLVCRRWFRLNNDREISEREKLYCYRHPDRSLDVLLEIIEKSKRNTLNLEFNDIDFSVNHTRSLQFWIDYGSRIESLSFRNCKLSDHNLRDVIEYCDNMRYLAILYPEFDLLCEECHESIEGSTFKKLINLDIRRPVLNSFKLKVYDEGWILSNRLRDLFAIYPNIVHFSFICDDFIDMDHSETLKDVQRKLENSRSIMKCINLDTHQLCEQMLHCFSVLMDFHFPELTDMRNIQLKLQAEHKFYNFLHRHDQLRSVKLNVEISRSKEGTALVERLMNCLLDSCPQLQSMQIKVSEHVCSSNRQIFKKIRISNLKSLALNFKMKVEKKDRKGERINNTLTYLHLSCLVKGAVFKISRQMTRAFIKTFRGLTELIIDGPGMNDYLLQDIFLYQRQLRTLKLRNDCRLAFGGPTDFGFTGIQPNGQRTGHSINDLTKLQSLVLSDPRLRASSQFFGELNFPNLSSLTLSWKSPLKLRDNDVIRAFSRLPNLEAIEIGGDLCNVSTWIEICQRLKKLRFLLLDSYSKEFNDEQSVLLFEMCPTLRFLHRIEVNISNDSIDFEEHQYNWDVLLGRVTKAEYPYEQLVPSGALASGSIGL